MVAICTDTDEKAKTPSAQASAGDARLSARAKGTPRRFDSWAPRLCRREVGWQAEHGEELPYAVVGVPGQHALFRAGGVAGLGRAGEVLQVVSGLCDQRQVAGSAVAGMDARDAVPGELLQLVQARQPAVLVALLQVEMRPVVDEVRRQQRPCLLSPSPNSTTSSFVPSTSSTGSASGSGTLCITASRYAPTSSALVASPWSTSLPRRVG